MNLPILSSRFFEDHRPDQGFFSKWRSFYSWDESIVPVYEWQNVLFVACLNPPSQFPQSSHKVVFVLAQASALQELWLNYISNERSDSFSPPPATGIPNLPSPDGPILSEPEQEPLAALDSNSTDEPLTDPLNLEEVPVTESTTQLLTSEAEGLALENLGAASSRPAALTDATSMGDDLFSQLQESEDSEAAVATAEIEEELLDLNLEPEPLATPSKIRPGSAKTLLKPLEEKTSLRQHRELTSESGESTVTNFKLGAAPEIRATPTRTEVLVNSPEPSAEEITRTSVTKLVSTPPAKLETWLEDVFKEMKKGFLKSMVLIKEGDKVRPWKWDSEFQHSSATATAISLQIPSPFRIVFRTQKPYHGSVSPSELNDSFFTEWNQSQIPEHLTVAPLIVNDHVIGMLLAIGTPNSNSKGNLNLAEAVANSMARQIHNRPEAFKAA